MIAAHHTYLRMPPLPRPALVNSRAEAVNRRRPKGEWRAGALAVHYQPRLHLATGEIAANEASIRWVRRGQRSSSPSVFTRADEPHVLIHPTDVWVLEEICREAARWNAARLSVNVSIRLLQSGDLPLQLATALEQSGLPPDRLELKLADSSVVDSGIDTLLALSVVRDRGVGLALDGFGAELSSPSMLKRLPFTAIKLDRLLTNELLTSRKGAAVVHAVIEAGRAMRLTTVAGGSETEAQRAFLSGIGCEEGQGDLFSHPVPTGQLRPTLGVACS